MTDKIQFCQFLNKIFLELCFEAFAAIYSQGKHKISGSGDLYFKKESI